MTNHNNVTNDLTENLAHTVLTDSIEKKSVVEEPDTVIVDYISELECLSEVKDNNICTEKQPNSQSLTKLVFITTILVL